MSQEQGADKTEKPTPKRLKDARKEGNVSKSQDFSRTASLLVWLILFWLLSGHMIDQVQQLFQTIFLLVERPSKADLIGALITSLKLSAIALLPFLVTTSLLGLFIEFIQVGAILSLKKVAPKLDHLNPAQGIKNVFSQKNLVELIKSIAKTVVLILVSIVIFKAMLPQYMGLSQSSLLSTMAVHWHAALWLIAATVFAFIFISILDAMYQRHEYIKNMMMSKQDIKQESKESEGDPMIKSKRRQLHQEWSEQNAIAATRRSNVVVTNPTHISVALRYDPEETDLPVVVAKGEDYMAARIRETAEEENIPVLHNIPLARGLYAEIEENNYITSDFFSAVAEVLKWAESMNQENTAITEQENHEHETGTE